MDLITTIKELVEERNLVEQAIASIERIAAQRGKRRGRPPAWVTLLANENGRKKRGRRPAKAKARAAH